MYSFIKRYPVKPVFDYSLTIFPCFHSELIKQPVLGGCFTTFSMTMVAEFRLVVTLNNVRIIRGLVFTTSSLCTYLLSLPS